MTEVYGSFKVVPEVDTPNFEISKELQEKINSLFIDEEDESPWELEETPIFKKYSVVWNGRESNDPITYIEKVVHLLADIDCKLFGQIRWRGELAYHQFDLSIDGIFIEYVPIGMKYTV